MSNSVTILLATHNGAAHLDAQLESFLTQTHKNWYLVASDDGSCDGTLEILRAFQQKIGKDRMQIVAGPCQGYAQNFMSLVYHCPFSTDFYCFSDQDDIWLPHKISSFVSHLAQQSPDDPTLYYARHIVMNKYGQSVFMGSKSLGQPTFSNALVQNIMSGNTQAFNQAFRQLLCQHPVKRVMSHDWWLYIFSTGIGARIIYDDQPVLLYRQHALNMLGSNHTMSAKMRRLLWMITRNYWRWTEDNLRACHHLKTVFTNDNRRQLNYFLRSRHGKVHKRLYNLYKSGVRRRSTLQNSALAVDTLLHGN